jgi:glutathione synthase/RimK-type ligase-like ATP-grasp enzyme
MSYDEIAATVGKTFIVKPTNASGSRCTFKVTSNENFECIKPKLSRIFDYMVEEYIG